MRKRTFEVPEDLMFEVAEIIEEHELQNQIQGVTDDGDIEIIVEYEADEKPLIDRIHELIDEHNDTVEDDDEDEDD